MATKSPAIVTLRGDARYGAFLDRLEAEARKRGHALDGRSGIVELACNALAEQWGIEAPRRAWPVGTNQFSETQGSAR